MSDVEFDSVGESDKANCFKVKPRKKTLKEQFNLIGDFMKSHNETLIGKDAFSVLWDGLTIYLNNPVPPIRTNIQWKKVWQEYNYNHEGRRPTTKTACSNLSDVSSSGASCSNESDHTSESNPFFIVQDRTDDVINKLDVLTKIQLETNEYLGIMLPQILKEQKETNDLLKMLCSRDAI